MNTDTLYKVANHSSTTKAQLSELDEMIAKYPWFSVAHLLKAKGMMESKDPDYPDQLQRASVHVNNRQVLFDFLHDHSEIIDNSLSETEKPEIAVVEESVIEEEVSIIEPSANLESIEKTKDEAPSIELEKETVEEDVPATSPELDPIEKEVAVEEDSIKEEEEIQPSANDEKPELQPEEVVAIEEDLEEEVSSTVEKVDPELEKDILTFAVSRIIEKEVQDEIPAKEELKEKPSQAAIEEDESELSPFARRLLRKAAKAGYGSSLDDSEKEADIDLKKESNQNRSSGELVDAFIRSSPRITPSRAPEYSPSDSAKQSLVEDDSFVTETMAKIYAQQGKIEKARKAYKLLSLKYPEKSIYFAHQLKKLGKNK